MNCKDVQELLGADPHTNDSKVSEHLSHCSVCAAQKAELERLDARVLEALKVEVPDGLMDFDFPSEIVNFPHKAPSRSLFPLAMAATILVAVGVSFLAWRSASIDTLHQDVIAHVHHEPRALTATTTPVALNKITRVAQRNGVQIVGDLGTVTYVKSCPFRGKMVTHLVTQTDHGPVTVLLLPGEEVNAVESIDEEGFKGTIVPVDGGSIIVVGEDMRGVKPVETQMMNAIQWDI